MFSRHKIHKTSLLQSLFAQKFFDISKFKDSLCKKKLVI